MEINDYIFKINVIPKTVCKEIIKKIKKKTWEKHQWYNADGKMFSAKKEEKKKELDVLAINEEMQKQMTPYLVKAYFEYNEKYNTVDRLNSLATKFSPIRFNKYKKGTLMRKHFDHIHALFDGQHKGIPVISFIGILNEDYTGGELIINDQKIECNTGDIIIFPSCFLYPHEVKKIKKGTRYSFVSWGF